MIKDQWMVIQINASYKPAFIYGGPTLSVSKLCETILPLLRENNNDLEVITTTANGEKELIVTEGEVTFVDGVPVKYFTRITKDHTHFSPDLLRYLWYRLGLKEKIKIVHIHAWWNLTSVLALFIAKWRKIPVILSPRGMITAYTLAGRNSFYKKILHRMMGKALLQYAHIHVTTEKEKLDVLDIVKPKSIHVIPNIVSFPHILTVNDFVKENLGTHKNREFKLIYLSRIEEKKGLEMLFKGLSLITFPWSLTIAGTGENTYIETLKTYIEELQIARNVKWVGFVDNENKFELLAKHDLMCLTSYNENFANVVIESISVGTAVFISDGVGLADYILKKQLGWVTSLNKIDIASKITTARNSFEQRNIIRKKGPEILNIDYDPVKLANKYVHFYEEILGNVEL